MKKTLCLRAAFVSAVFAALVLFLPQGPAHAADKGQVVVYNWSEYIPQSVLDDFTRETGIKVVYSTFESNEAMYAKVKLLRGKSYDVVVPSGYFVDLLRRDNLLRELDHGRLSNLGNLDPKMLDQEYDPGNKYSIPYMWGALGFAYNSKFVPDGSLTRWDQMLDPRFKGKIILTDDLRDAFGLALRSLGHSVNSKAPEEIKAAFEFLVKLKPSVRVFDVTAIKQALISEEVWMGPIWNGDYLVALEENDRLRFVFPEEGAVLWADSFVIPIGAENVDNAYIFIDYMLRPEVAVRCIEEYKYSSPNLKAVALLPDELKNNSILVPGDKELKNAEFTTGLGETLGEYEKYWEQLKATQ
ncbi:spermidine/putrescine ABC transporter substrate-binding protein [Desulfovibrio sp. OttesenSCG-928-A18]|nr:spermidine/putrescine ABC transporter substrate-binding protein [Desulfovibrio sp. OttesenSCG-928-A18]